MASFFAPPCIFCRRLSRLFIIGVAKIFFSREQTVSRRRRNNNRSRQRAEREGRLEDDRLSNVKPVSIQTQSLALRALRSRKPQETQALALASSQSFHCFDRAFLLAGACVCCVKSACVSCGFRLRNARNASDCV